MVKPLHGNDLQTCLRISSRRWLSKIWPQKLSTQRIMTDSDKTTMHMLQRALNVDHYLLVNWDEIVKIKKLLRKASRNHLVDVLDGLLEVQASSVPEGFEGPLIQQNMVAGFPPSMLKVSIESETCEDVE